MAKPYIIAWKESPKCMHCFDLEAYSPEFNFGSFSLCLECMKKYFTDIAEDYDESEAAMAKAFEEEDLVELARREAGLKLDYYTTKGDYWRHRYMRLMEGKW